MSHFEIEQWVDFARGASPTAGLSVMESHLASGCARCRRVVDVLTGVAAIARAEKVYEPPAGAIRLAKALYALPRPQRLIARLVFDSFLQPLPAGVRAQDRLTRHVLYEADEYSLDVRVDQHGAPNAATLVGQLVTRDSAAFPSGDVQVMLRNRKKTVAAASCNTFGEFQLDYRPAPALQLEVSLGSTGQVLEVPLAHVLEPAGEKRAKPPGFAR